MCKCLPNLCIFSASDILFNCQSFHLKDLITAYPNKKKTIFLFSVTIIIESYFQVAQFLHLGWTFIYKLFSQILNIPPLAQTA